MACSSSTTPGPDGGKAGKDGGAGTGGGGTAGGTAGADAAAGTAGTTDGPMDVPQDGGDGGLTGPALRGQYLVNNVLGCSGCHTPQKAGGGGPDLTKFLSGVECFAKDTAGLCLNSANLTNDATGLMKLSDQQIKDAFTMGVFPGAADAGTQYLFANMPYYQFANLSSDDASAIVAYLRTVTAVAHMAPANGGMFATRPTSAQWTPVTLAALPSPAAAATDGGADGGGDAGTDAAATEAGTDGGTSASVSNGKYLAALVCSTCHTVNTSATAPFQLDATKAYQGGKEFTTTITVAADGGTDAGADGGTDAGADGGDAGPTTISKKIMSANLTPDMTGLKDWTPAQIVTAIKKATDEAGRTICSPMRSLPNITDQDALDIANYLKAIPPVTNAITETCE
ncbi:MAG TPA: c-type cytochrome [Polyangia bacterium]|nr:c-type cytochrome [Polyangia bacterium]